VGANGLTPNAIGALACLAIRDGFNVITTQRTIHRDGLKSFSLSDFLPSDFGRRSTPQWHLPPERNHPERPKEEQRKSLCINLFQTRYRTEKRIACDGTKASRSSGPGPAGQIAARSHNPLPTTGRPWTSTAFPVHQPHKTIIAGRMQNQVPDVRRCGQRETRPDKMGEVAVLHPRDQGSGQILADEEQQYPRRPRRIGEPRNTPRGRVRGRDFADFRQVPSAMDPGEAG
jgi:hypothetical protein